MLPSLHPSILYSSSWQHLSTYVCIRIYEMPGNDSIAMSRGGIWILSSCLQTEVELVLGDVVHIGIEQETAALVLQGPAEGPVSLKCAYEIGAALLSAARDEFYARLLLREGHTAQHTNTLSILNACLKAVISQSSH
jgi:hypothetical protein